MPFLKANGIYIESVKATSILEPRWPLIRRIFISRGLTIGLVGEWFKSIPRKICLHHNKRGNFKRYLRRNFSQTVLKKIPL